MALDSLREVSDPLTLGVHASILNVTVRRWLRGPGAEADDHLILSEADRPGGPPDVEVAKDASFAHFLELVATAHQGDSLKFTTIRLKKPDRDPEFTTDSKGQLSILVHDLTFEVPVPASVAKGALAGFPAKVYSFKIPEARFVLSWRVEPRALGRRHPPEGSGRELRPRTVPQGLRDRGPRERRHTAEPLPHDPHLRLDPGQDPGPTHRRLPEQATGLDPRLHDENSGVARPLGLPPRGPCRRQGPAAPDLNRRCADGRTVVPPGPEAPSQTIPPPVAAPGFGPPCGHGSRVSHPYSRQS